MEEITPPVLKRNFGSGDLTKYSKAYEEGKRKAYENDNSIDYISDISSSSDMYEGETNISYPFFQMDSFSDHVSNDNERNKFTFSESSYEKNVSSDCMTVDEKMGKSEERNDNRLILHLADICYREEGIENFLHNSDNDDEDPYQLELSRINDALQRAGNDDFEMSDDEPLTNNIKTIV